MQRYAPIVAVLVGIALLSCSKSSGKKRVALALKAAGFTDVNTSGTVDAGDMLTVTFNGVVTMAGTPAADAVFALDPPGSFGTGAVVTAGGSAYVEIVLQAGVSLQPNGIYGSDPGATGLNLLPTQTDLTNPVGKPIPALASPVDIAGGLIPRIISVTFGDVNGNCQMDQGDTLSIAFDSNVSVTTSDPEVAFQLPVAGDSLGTGPVFTGGTPTDVGTVVIILGTAPTLQIQGTFDPMTVTPGSPSGIDVTSTVGVVTAANDATISATPNSPPGHDVPGGSDLLWSSVGDDVAGAGYGENLGSAGDVNGDGYADVIVGAPGFSTAYVYHGNPGGLDVNPAWTSVGDGQPGEWFGSGVACAGDVNNDGFDDVIVGSGGYNATNTDAGKAYVYLGSVTGLGTSPFWTSSGEDATDARFGDAVSSAGDVDNNGYHDILVGARGFVSAGNWTGKGYVYLASATGIDTVPVWTSLGDDQALANFAHHVACAGDVNGDGFDDILCGAPGYDTTNGNAGKAYLFEGSASGPSALPDWFTVGEDQGGAQLGYCVSGAGDVDGDGFDDVIAGAARFSTTISLAGRAYVYMGSPAGLGNAHAWTASGDQASCWFAGEVTTAGDVNGDGFDDVIIGAVLYDTPTPDAGKAYVYLGSGSGLGATAAWTSIGDDQADAFFGNVVASAGDVRGTGNDVVLIGANQFSTTNSQAGKAYLYCVAP